MYRFFETLPAILAWITLILMVALSRYTPTFVAIFIILFDIYWLLKTIYLSLHLRATFGAMKENLKVNWARRLDELSRVGPPTAEGASELRSWRDIHHLIILPMYREPYEVVRESFESLVRSNYPKEKFLVVLATEERAGEDAQIVARKIEREFGGKFSKFLATVHPQNLAEEIPGKGSNETWAIREVKRLIIDPLVADSMGTKKAARNFSETPQPVWLGVPDRSREPNWRGQASSPPERAKRVEENDAPLSYKNILVSVFDIDTQVFPEYFGRLTYAYLTASNRDRAIYQPVPLFTNNIYVAPALARVVAFSATFWQMMQQSRPERLTSFSSQSLPFQVLIDIGFWHKDIVSEDSRVFWQGYLRYHGDFRVEPLLYPVSMDANVAPTFWATMKNIYKQQRRWAWGVENTPYLLDGFRKDPKIPARKKWYWTFVDLEGRHSWATNSLMIFALGWLPVILGGKKFHYTLLSYGLPQITRFIISLSMIGIASSAILGILLLPPRPKWFGWMHYLVYFLQWLLMPITLIIFGALPGLEAQTRIALGGKWRLGFWVTPKGRYPETGKGVGGKLRSPV